MVWSQMHEVPTWERAAVTWQHLAAGFARAADQAFAKICVVDSFKVIRLCSVPQLQLI